MIQSDKKNVDQFIADIGMLNADFHRMFTRLRQYFKRHGADLDEGIKYGGLVFSRNNRLVGGIYVYKKHLSVEFSHGAEFSDPKKLLQGGGKFRRHIKFFEEKDITENEAETFIRLACNR